MRKLDLKLNQEVVVKIIKGSNVSRNKDMSLENIDNWCYKGIVTKIGRKYITVKWDKWSEVQFDKESDYRNKTEGSCDYKLYLSKEEIIEEHEADKLYKNIRDKYFDRYGGNNGKFTLDQLKRFMEIIKENEE